MRPTSRRLEGGHRHGHREVGLAGAGRPQAKGDGVSADGVHVALLAGRLGADGAAAEGEQDVVARERDARGAVADLVHDDVHLARRGGPPPASTRRMRREKTEVSWSTTSAGPDTLTVLPPDRDQGVEGGLDAPEQGVGRAHQHGGIDRVGDGEAYLRWLHVPPGTAATQMIAHRRRGLRPVLAAFVRFWATCLMPLSPSRAPASKMLPTTS